MHNVFSSWPSLQRIQRCNQVQLPYILTETAAPVTCCVGTRAAPRSGGVATQTPLELDEAFLVQPQKKEKEGEPDRSNNADVERTLCCSWRKNHTLQAVMKDYSL
ncbi:hypothetical protein Pcinc_005485 [Petrolisthes cinctipes]|uniref:Uncharacterized protein n=1 Tax=Petrolisthes cinctipes TaxID=88211 RepID=A0AAE1L2N9_PETCI|nr:hypothetical protein Pcinc_005485 [Petrolisthes cinctipes]